MKKVLVLLLTLSFVGVFAFAAAPEFKPAVTLSGEASVTFGVNLDNEATGISNATDGDITLTFVDGTDEKGGKEGETVYGWIKIKSALLKLSTDDGTQIRANDGIEAKLFLGPVYMDIMGDGAGTAKTVVAGALLDVDGNATMDVLGLTAAAKGAAFDTPAEYKGFFLGLVDTAVVDVKVGVQSKYDWLDAGGANVDQIYQFWGAVALKAVENLTVEAKAAANTDNDAVGLGVKAGYKIVIAEGYAVTPTVAADFRFANDLTYRLSAGVLLGLPGASKGDWDKFTKMPGAAKSDVNAGLGVQFAMDNAEPDAGMDLTVSLFDGDLIPVLDVIAIGEILGLGLDAQAIGIGAYASADLGMVVPFAAVETTAVVGADHLYVQAGVDLKVITNTTFTLGYESGDLAGNAATEKGIITFTTKIAY